MPSINSLAIDQEFFDMLPSDWTVKSLDTFANTSTGGTPDRKRSDYYGDDFPWVKSGELRDTVICQTEELISKRGLENSNAKLFPRGTLLMALYGATTGKVGILDIQAATNQAICAIFPDQNVVDNSYLFYSLMYLRPHLLRARYGGAQPNISQTIVRNLLVPVPPLPEQRAIAHVLRTLQRAKEATEKVIAATHQLKQSLMRHLFTYGPVPFDQADQIELKETEFGNVPVQWRVAALSDCAEVQTGIAKGRKVEASDAIMVPYLRVANVQDGFLDLKEIKEIQIRKGELERFALQVGDVLLTEGGDFDKLGRGFIWNGEVPTCVHQNHIFAVRANRQIISSDYLAYLTQSQYGKSYFLTVAHRTTHLACINTTKLKALPVPVPPLQGQEEIARRLKTIDRKYETEMHGRNALDGLLHTLLHSLMRGQIRLPGFASGKA